LAADSGVKVSFFFEQRPVTAQCFLEKESQCKTHQIERAYRWILAVTFKYVVTDLLLCEFSPVNTSSALLASQRH
jgi:hypothetical protein